MTDATCVTPGCERPVWVKSTGECSTCQSRRYRRDNPGKGHTLYPMTCEVCGREGQAQAKGARFCSLRCNGESRRKVCKIPADHPVLREIARQKAARRPRVASTFTPEQRECAWCGEAFTASRSDQVFCSVLHRTKAKRVRRRGRAAGSTSHYTWSEFMRVYLKFDRCCAYCEQPIDGQPDPDHVLPLSRGGSNSIANILPACRSCNSDKRDLTLTQWAADRSRRGLAGRVTSWSIDDPRTQHLTSLCDAA